MKQILLMILVAFGAVASNAVGLNEKTHVFSNGVSIVIRDTNTSSFGGNAAWQLSVTNRSNEVATYAVNLWPSKISYRGDLLQQYDGFAVTNSLPSMTSTNHVCSIPFNSYLPWDDLSTCFETTMMADSGEESWFSEFRSGLSVPEGMLSINCPGEAEGNPSRIETVLSYSTPINTTDLSVRLEVCSSNLTERFFAYKPQGAYVAVTNTIVNPAPGNYLIKGQILASNYSFYVPATNIVIRNSVSEGQ